MSHLKNDPNLIRGHNTRHKGVFTNYKLVGYAAHQNGWIPISNSYNPHNFWKGNISKCPTNSPYVSRRAPRKLNTLNFLPQKINFLQHFCSHFLASFLLIRGVLQFSWRTLTTLPFFLTSLMLCLSPILWFDQAKSCLGHYL